MPLTFFYQDLQLVIHTWERANFPYLAPFLVTHPVPSDYRRNREVSRNLLSALEDPLHTPFLGPDSDGHRGVGGQLSGAPGGHQGDGVLRREAEAIRRHANHRCAAGRLANFSFLLYCSLLQ